MHNFERFHLLKIFLPKSDIFEGSHATFAVVVEDADSQAFELVNDAVCDVTILGPPFVLVSGVGSIFAQNRPTAVDPA